jgi:hypothetical protein
LRRRREPVTKGFQLPENTWAIAVEDSAVQRKLLGRFLQTEGGVSKDRCVILGQTAKEIMDFIETTKELMQQHQPDHFLVIVDENLDIIEGNAVSHTISGSALAQKLRESLEDDSRLLSLVRSANDSVKETQLYQSRAHGFLSKGPLGAGKTLLDEIKPWWKRRFQSQSMPDLLKLCSSSSLSDSSSFATNGTTAPTSCASSLSGSSSHSDTPMPSTSYPDTTRQTFGDDGASTSRLTMTAGGNGSTRNITKRASLASDTPSTLWTSAWSPLTATTTV